MKVVGCEDWVQDNNLPQWGPGGAAPSCWAIFCDFSKKTSHFNAIWMTFCTGSMFLEQLETAKLLRWGPGDAAPSHWTIFAILQKKKPF